ncbi:MAG TPA: hypothetical protein VHD57_09860 [Vicinamibacterales bacterium]|nr:hypothetical protein [Vicinamibacterales bacterium]
MRIMQEPRKSTRSIKAFGGAWHCGHCRTCRGISSGCTIVDSCAETGSDGALCALPDGTPPGMAAPFELTFTQARESVSGTITIGGIVSAPFTTSMSAFGLVTITLSRSDQNSGTFLSETFSLSRETPGRIDGTMTLTITNSGASVDVGAHLANVVRQ